MGYFYFHSEANIAELEANHHLELARFTVSFHRRAVFTPRWKKEALLWLKSSKKFLHYKRDLLESDRIVEIESRRTDLKNAIKDKDLDAVNEAQKQLRNTCEKSLRHYNAPSWLEENIEVFWVAIVVALGIRAFFLQPFRIPTGSMQPSLNGINLQDQSADASWEMPWIGKRAFDYVFSGKSYSKVIADKDQTIASIADASWFLFSRSKVTFQDGSSITVSAPPQETSRLDTISPHVVSGPDRNGKFLFKRGVHYKKGDPIFVGTRITGDLVLVNKFSYHFRKPKRSESFVFDTIGLKTGGGDQGGGSHYIKRLAGLPGDKIQIQAPSLYLNDKLAQEETFQRVASMKNGYLGYTNPPRRYGSPFWDSDHFVTLKKTEDPNFNEYFALGDNSGNSSDSRMWGTVKQFNLVGPALFSLWPFGSGHWGFIK